MLKETVFGEYLIRELTIGQFIPVMQKMRDDNLTQQAQIEMMSFSVCDSASGQPLGTEGLNKLGASEYLPLWNAVAELHGLIASEKKSDA